MSTTETQAVPAGTWALDPVHSAVGFAVGYLAGTFTGSFGDFDAVVTDGVLTGAARVASVQAKDPDLETHLQSPSSSTPSATRSLPSSRTRSNAPGNRIRIDGEITIKGHTEPVEITGDITDPNCRPLRDKRFGLSLAAVIPRDEFGSAGIAHFRVVSRRFPRKSRSSPSSSS